MLTGEQEHLVLLFMASDDVNDSSDVNTAVREGFSFFSFI